MSRIASHEDVLSQGPVGEAGGMLDDASSMALAGSADLSSADLSSSDLAELMAAFTEVTTKLERTHGQLRAEVGRLNQELHQANEALQRSRRLAALGEMAAGISHEIRNPLGSIRLYANMLCEDLAEMPEQRKIVDKIGRAVRGLDEIVGDVLTFAREMKTHWQPCQMAELIDQSLDMCLVELDGTEVTVECACDDEISCDATLVPQALINVIRNAGQANAASGGGRLMIEVGSGVIEEQGREVDCLRISVSDEGGGMPEEVIDRMFNPFFTTRAAGTGLGLAIVHRIVDAHHGKIRVSNIEEVDARRSVGARVEILLPREQPMTVVHEQPVPCRGEVVVKSRRVSASL